MDLFAHACVREFPRLTSHFGSKSVSSLVKHRPDESNWRCTGCSGSEASFNARSECSLICSGERQIALSTERKRKFAPVGRLRGPVVPPENWRLNSFPLSSEQYLGHLDRVSRRIQGTTPSSECGANYGKDHIRHRQYKPCSSSPAVQSSKTGNEGVWNHTLRKNESQHLGCRYRRSPATLAGDKP
jgi:hypothetical protein